MNRRARLHTVVREALAERDAVAFVAAGPVSDPEIRYCLSARDRHDGYRHATNSATRAIAVTADEILEVEHESPLEETTTGEGTATASHPADRLADRLVDRLGPTTILAPRTIPHDAALYFEHAGFDLVSSDLLERSRTRKTADECDRIERAQAAATAGLERAAAVLAAATGDDRRLSFEGDHLTPSRLRVAIDEAIVRAGGFPVGHTSVRVGSGDGRRDNPLRADEPITLEVAPREPGGYFGGLARTLVVDGEGGPERRAHVAITRAFRSARSLLATEGPTIGALEGDLEAEIRAFGFDDGVETSAHGVGLEPLEAPGGTATGGRETIPTGSVLRLEAAVDLSGSEDGQVRLADLVCRTDGGESGDEGGTAGRETRSDHATVRLLEGPSRSLEPTALL